MKSLSEIPIGVKFYLLVSAALSSVFHVWYYEPEGSIRIRKSEWGAEGSYGVLNSAQQFIFMSCAGLALYALAKWLWKPEGPARFLRTPEPGRSRSSR